MEITLRTPAGLEAIRRAVLAAPQARVGAGTCLSRGDLEDARAAGAAFAVSPGTSPTLLQAARELALPYLPGVATASDIMTCVEHGYRTLKLFPAGPLGGAVGLKALSAPFPQVRFCPTGGLEADDIPVLLRLPGVVAVGGSWLAPERLIRQRDWSAVTKFAEEAIAVITRSSANWTSP